MGADATRITAADFLTPPELKPWRLASDGTGRIGGVRLSLRADHGDPCLEHCYQQVPVRVLPPFHFGTGQPSLLYLLNPTAGLMDGDGHLVEIRVGAGVRTVVAGQSATRIHPALHGWCTQQWRLQVATGAVLVVLPGPAIPYQGCRYYQRVDVELEEGAHLLWGDIWTAGRYSRGAASEQFQFATLLQEFAVHRQGRLVYRDRFCWQGPWDPTTASWYFGEYPTCGSLFATGPIATEILLQDRDGGVHLPTAFGDTCLRWCGPTEAIRGSMVRVALSIAGQRTGERGPWLLGGHDLGPNHWFSVSSNPW